MKKTAVILAISLGLLGYVYSVYAAPPTPVPQNRPVVQRPQPVRTAPPPTVQRPVTQPAVQRPAVTTPKTQNVAPKPVSRPTVQPPAHKPAPSSTVTKPTTPQIQKPQPSATSSPKPVKTQVVSPNKVVQPTIRSITLPGTSGSTTTAVVPKAEKITGAKGVARSVTTEKQATPVAIRQNVAVATPAVAKKVIDNVMAKTNQLKSAPPAVKNNSQKAKTGSTQLTDKEVGAMGKGVGGALEKAGFNLINPSSSSSPNRPSSKTADTTSGAIKETSLTPITKNPPLITNSAIQDLNAVSKMPPGYKNTEQGAKQVKAAKDKAQYVVTTIDQSITEAKKDIARIGGKDKSAISKLENNIKDLEKVRDQIVITAKTASVGVNVGQGKGTVVGEGTIAGGTGKPAVDTKSLGYNITPVVGKKPAEVTKEAILSANPKTKEELIKAIKQAGEVATLTSIGAGIGADVISSRIQKEFEKNYAMAQKTTGMRQQVYIGLMEANATELRANTATKESQVKYLSQLGEKVGQWQTQLAIIGSKTGEKIVADTSSSSGKTGTTTTTPPAKPMSAEDNKKLSDLTERKKWLEGRVFSETTHDNVPALEAKRQAEISKINDQISSFKPGGTKVDFGAGSFSSPGSSLGSGTQVVSGGANTYKGNVHFDPDPAAKDPFGLASGDSKSQLEYWKLTNRLERVIATAEPSERTQAQAIKDKYINYKSFLENPTQVDKAKKAIKDVVGGGQAAAQAAAYDEEREAHNRVRATEVTRDVLVIGAAVAVGSPYLTLAKAALAAGSVSEALVSNALAAKLTGQFIAGQLAARAAIYEYHQYME